VGGLLQHAPSLIAFTNPTAVVNLLTTAGVMFSPPAQLPAYEAPVNWS